MLSHFTSYAVTAAVTMAVAVAVTASAHERRYYSRSGRECLSPCVGQCATSLTNDRALVLEPCARHTLVYFTTQHRQCSPQCVGPCARHGQTFTWCTVSASDWDYCSDKTKTELVFEYQTPTLRNSWLSIVPDCGPGARHYIRGHSPRGEPCRDRCARRGRGTELTCHVRDAFGANALSLCAPPARFYTHADD